MTKYKEKIVDISTGEESFIDYTPEMIKEAEAGEIEATIKTKKMAEVEIKRLSALAKLEAIGLTSDDLKALGL